MAINVQYGDISSALGLALRAGEGVRQRTQNQQDMEFLNLVGQEQARADAQHASEISRSLGVDRANADLQMHQRQLDSNAAQDTQQNALRQQQIQAQQQEAQARLAQSQNEADRNHQFQQADHDMKVQAFQDKQSEAQTKEKAINALTPDQQNVVRATGHMPYVSREGDPASQAFKLLEAESRRLGAILQQADAAKSKTLEGQLGQAPPDTADIAKLRLQKSQVDAELQQQTQGLIQTGKLNNTAIAQQAVEARQQPASQDQTAPAQQPRFLQVKRNPQDGRLWGFDANQGRWIPVPQ